MSFGWSAGDILAAANFCRIVGKALHDSKGSKSDFQSAAQYIETVAKTLDGLVSTIRNNADLQWEDSLIEQVNILRAAITAFEDKIAKYEASLKRNSRRKKMANVPREVQFAFSSVKELQRDISQPQLVLNNFINIQTLSTTLEILKTSKVSLTTLSNFVDGVGTLSSAVSSQLKDIESTQQQSAIVLRDTLRGVDTHMSDIVALQRTMQKERKVDIKMQQQWQDKLQTSIQGLVDCNKAQLEALLTKDKAVAGNESLTYTRGLIGNILMLIGNGVAGTIGGFVALNHYQATTQSRPGITSGYYSNEYRNPGTSSRGDMKGPVLRQDSFPTYLLDFKLLKDYLESVFQGLRIPILRNYSNDEYIFNIPRDLTEEERGEISRLRGQTSDRLSSSPTNCKAPVPINDEESEEVGTKRTDLALLIKDGEGEYIEVHAILDLDCKDNWISSETVKSLFIQRDVQDCQIVKTRVASGELTANQKVILEWQLKENPRHARTDDFFIFREAVDVEVILGSDTTNSGSQNPDLPRRPRDHDDGNSGSSSIATTNGTARTHKSGESTTRGSSSNGPPKSQLHISASQTKPFSARTRRPAIEPKLTELEHEERRRKQWERNRQEALERQRLEQRQHERERKRAYN